MSLFKKPRKNAPKNLNEKIEQWRRGRRKEPPPAPPVDSGQEVVLFRETPVVPYAPLPHPVPPRLEQQLEKWRGQHKDEQPALNDGGAIYPPRLVLHGNGNLYAPPPILDLPRYCAVHDGAIWFARYIRHNGIYVYGGCISQEDVRGPQYAPEDVFDLPADFEPDREECICGARTHEGSIGAVKCGRCNALVCYGRTTRRGYFFCRESCGGHGQLVPADFPEKGISPSRYRRGHAAE